jgi:hypothetical protein
MVALVIALVLICLGAAVAGVLVAGLFWLTLVALAGLLVTGAAGVSMIRPPVEGGASPGELRPQLSVISSAVGARDRGASQDGGELRRAA